MNRESSIASGAAALSGRVLLIAPQPFFLNRGTPMNVRAMAIALSSLGVEVDLLAYPLGEYISIPGVRILRSRNTFKIAQVPIGPSWRKIVLDVELSLKALCLALSNRYLVIQGVEEAGVIAWFLARLTRSRCIFDMDSCMVTQIQSSGFFKSRLLLRLISIIETFCIRRSDAIITVCQSLTEKVKSFAPEATIYQIEDFPLEDAQLISPQTSERISQELNLQGRPFILYTGNLEPYQGVELLLDAFKLLLSGLPCGASPILGIVGGDASQVSALRQRLSSLDLQAHVRLLGARPLSEMGSFMSLADVLASPRLLGTNTPLKLYSYMAAERPIVATRIESHTQVLSEDCAYLAEPEAESLSCALKAALDSSASATSARQAKVAKCLKLVQTRYSRRAFTDRLQALYTKLLGSPGPATQTQVQHEPAR